MEVCKFLDLRDIETGNSQILAELVELQVVLNMHSTLSMKLLSTVTTCILFDEGTVQKMTHACPGFP